METARFGEQVFSRNEGLDVIRRLPGEAQSTLRQYELLAVWRNFAPLAPLHAHGVPLKGHTYYHAAITDWHLFLVGKGDHDGKVVLELPLLCIRDLAKEDLDGEDVMILPDMPHQPLKSSKIAIYPQVDHTRIPKKEKKGKGSKEAGSPEVSADSKDKLTKPAGLVAPQPWYKKLVPGGASKEESPEAAGSAVQLQQRQMQPGLDLQTLHLSQQQRQLQQEMLDKEASAQQQAYRSEYVQQQQLLHQQQQAHSSPGAVAESIEPLLSPSLSFSPHQQQQQGYVHASNNFSTATATGNTLQQPQQQQAHMHANNNHSPASNTLHHSSSASALHASWPTPSAPQQPHFSSTSPTFAQQPHFSNSSPTFTPSPRSSTRLPTPPLTSYSGPLHTRLKDANTSPHSNHFTSHSPLPSFSLDSPREPVHKDWVSPKVQLPVEPLDLRSPVLSPVEQPERVSQWQPAPHKQAGPAVDEEEGESRYALVLMTVEHKSNFYNHLRHAWIQAHLRLSISQAQLPGMPLWYTPPSSMDGLLPFILKVNGKLPGATDPDTPSASPSKPAQSPSKSQSQNQQSQGSSSAGKELMRLSDQKVLKSTVEKDQAAAGVQQLLRFFGYATLQDALSSTSGPSSILDLFPGDNEASASDDSDLAVSEFEATGVWQGGQSVGSNAAWQGPGQGPLYVQGKERRGASRGRSTEDARVDAATLRQAQLLRMRMARHSRPAPAEHQTTRRTSQQQQQQQQLQSVVQPNLQLRPLHLNIQQQQAAQEAAQQERVQAWEGNTQQLQQQAVFQANQQQQLELQALQQARQQANQQQQQPVDLLPQQQPMNLSIQQQHQWQGTQQATNPPLQHQQQPMSIPLQQQQPQLQTQLQTQPSLAGWHSNPQQQQLQQPLHHPQTHTPPSFSPLNNFAMQNFTEPTGVAPPFHTHTASTQPGAPDLLQDLLLTPQQTNNSQQAQHLNSQQGLGFAHSQPNHQGQSALPQGSSQLANPQRYHPPPSFSLPHTQLNQRQGYGLLPQPQGHAQHLTQPQQGHTSLPQGPLHQHQHQQLAHPQLSTTSTIDHQQEHSHNVLLPPQSHAHTVRSYAQPSVVSHCYGQQRSGPGPLLESTQHEYANTQPAPIPLHPAAGQYIQTQPYGYQAQPVFTAPLPQQQSYLPHSVQSSVQHHSPYVQQQLPYQQQPPAATQYQHPHRYHQPHIQHTNQDPFLTAQQQQQPTAIPIQNQQYQQQQHTTTNQDPFLAAQRQQHQSWAVPHAHTHPFPSASLYSSQTPKEVLVDMLQEMAANVNYGHDPYQMDGIYSSAEDVMLRGCSLFDDEDVVMLKELVLEHSLAGTSKARAYAKRFFDSKPTMAFIIARLYAWGSLCAMFGPAVRSEDLVDTIQQQSVTASRAQPLHPSYLQTQPHQQHLHQSQGQSHRLSRGQGEPAASVQSSSSDCPSSYVAWVLGKNKDLEVEASEECVPSPHASHSSPWGSFQQSGASKASPPHMQHSASLPRSSAAQSGERSSNIWNQLLHATNQLRAEHEARERMAQAGISPRGPIRSSDVKGHSSSSGPAQSRRATVDLNSFLPDHVPTKTQDEEDYDFFMQLHQGHSGDACLPALPKLRHVLRRLGLHPAERTSIGRTVAVVEELALDARRHTAAAGNTQPVYERSLPPPCPSPSPLSPSDPLMLSPMTEQPYLFALALPPSSPSKFTNLLHRSGNALHQGVPAYSGSKPHTGQQQLRGSSYMKAGNEKGGGRQQAMQEWLAELEQRGLQRHQAMLRGTEVGDVLHNTFHTDILDDGMNDSPDQSPAQARWERLVGRLCARLAWRKVRMLLHFLHNMLAFSGGTGGGRLGWLSEQVVEVGGDEAHQVWSFRQCSQHLAALLMQLRAPTGTPLLHHLRPCTSTDMLAWCRGEAGQSPGQALDDCAGCLVELSNASKEAVALGRLPKGAGNVVADVVQQMPAHVVRTFSRRSLCRVTCLLAGAAACHELRGNQDPLPELADVAAYKHCEVLLHGGLLRKPQAGVAAAIHDSLNNHIVHLIRTPQVSAALDARCSDVVLSGIVSRMYKQVLECCSGDRRPVTHHQTDLPAEQYHNAAAQNNFRMPLVLT